MRDACIIPRCSTETYLKLYSCNSRLLTAPWMQHWNQMCPVTWVIMEGLTACSCVFNRLPASGFVTLSDKELCVNVQDWKISYSHVIIIRKSTNCKLPSLFLGNVWCSGLFVICNADWFQEIVWKLLMLTVKDYKKVFVTVWGWNESEMRGWDINKVYRVDI